MLWPLAAAACQAQAQSWPAGSTQAEPAAPASTPAYTLTGSATLLSDYRFRGISQSWLGPALQGGLELGLPQGGYLGLSGSSVSRHSYLDGRALELDLYGGWRTEVAPGWTGDVGLLHYNYPGARIPLEGGTSVRYDTTEAYLGLSHGGFSAKWSLALTPYFGLRGSTAASAFAQPLEARGSSRGSSYLDLNYQHAMGWATLGLHAGYTQVRRYSELSYADWRVSLAHSWGPWTASLAWADTSARASYYRAANAAGQMQSLGRGGWVLSLSTAF
jgi:uncharacterized protein (TIGR02001 family)